ncbi:MAG: tyrosine recombinase XerC [Oscillospiraceae bacterium]|nr:tyrosine recombinase XerC [Oscillospiraceae bacterium]
MDYREFASPLLCDFFSYHESVKGHSNHTVDEYFLDLRGFFRYMKRLKRIVPFHTPDDEIPIDDIDIEFIRQVSLGDVYSYLSYLNREKGLNEASRARKISALKSLFKYLTLKTHQLSTNPIQDLDSPKIRKSLPRYLTLEESIQLLQSVQGKNPERDYCILVFFLNCGLRISELVGLNVSDIHGNRVRVLGKGNKERILYLNDSCIDALENYLVVRNGMTLVEPEALFVSNQRKRISKSAVHLLVKNNLTAAGLDPSLYSAHKLRHTAATLMLQSGVDVRTLQEVLGHDHLNTTQIYTHVSSENLADAAAMNPLSHLKDKKRGKKNISDCE